MPNSKSEETYSEEETVARREAALKRMLATPHRPHKFGGEAKASPPPRSQKKDQKPS